MDTEGVAVSVGRDAVETIAGIADEVGMVRSLVGVPVSVQAKSNTSNPASMLSVNRVWVFTCNLSLIADWPGSFQNTTAKYWYYAFCIGNAGPTQRRINEVLMKSLLTERPSPEREIRWSGRQLVLSDVSAQHAERAKGQPHRKDARSDREHCQQRARFGIPNLPRLCAG